jgi:hypothetical protein
MRRSPSRREALFSALFGAGGVGLRALATGLPASFLANPRRALAAGPPGACATASRAQYVVFSTSGDGDPINTSVPGTYEDSKIVHSPDPAMAPRPLVIRGQAHTAAGPWATLPQAVLDRTVFWHVMTDTPVHSQEPEVLNLMDTTAKREMLPSLLAAPLAACLGTIQRQPISVGALTPSETLSFGGAPLPVVPPLALRATLANPTGPLSALQSLRTSTLDQLYDVYRSDASPAQRRYLDSLLTSQRQVRAIEQDLLDALSLIRDNGAEAQILAAVTLIRMRVSPVVTIHVPFGGDNHRDLGLETETAQTLSGIAAIASLMRQIGSAGLQDRVTFMTLNVFGRTLGPGSANGRAHNANHQVSLSIGRPFRGGVIGAVAPVSRDYGAMAIDTQSGAGRPDGDIPAKETLGAFARTMLAAVGADPNVVTKGKVVQTALA